MRILRRSKSRPSILESLLLLLLSTTCAGTETTTCSTGLMCPSGKVCVNDGKACAVPSCGNGVVEKALGESCDDGPNNEPAAGADCSAKCELSECDNGVVEFNETCDPSANGAGDACQDDCHYLAACGNGIWDGNMGEECDGRDLPPGSELLRCSDECKVVSCGNGLVEEQAGESCDPGVQDGPPCNDDCTLSVCGDGKLGPQEACDPKLDPDCEGECTRLKNCGDGKLDKGEECDPNAEGSSPEACTPTCKIRGCGNAIVDQIGEFDEACDDGNTVGGDGCSANCKSRESCGNGVIDRDFLGGEADERWELCDDGNTGDGDQCSSNCRLSAACGNKKLDLGEDCDNGKGDQDGRTVETAQCNTDCRTPLCGDGIINRSAGEACDKSTPADTEDCNGASAVRPDYTSVACQAPLCGDQYVNAVAGEECEPVKAEVDEASGDTSACNGAQAPDEAKCHLPRCGDGYVNEQAAEECEPSLEEGFNEDTKDSPTCNGESEPTPEGARCKVATCGDGYTNTTAGEACDDGPETANCNRSAEAAAAGVDCLGARCGDGYINTAAGEECEPGMGGEPVNEAGDTAICNGAGGGAVACKRARCGDSYTNRAASECGDAPGDTTLCNSNQAGGGVACKAKLCGDRYVNHQAEEVCDLGSADTVACNGNLAGELSCKQTECGDGYTNQTAGEQCDPNSAPESSAWNNCNGPEAGQFKCLTRACGDGFLHPQEACDSNVDSTTCNGKGAVTLAGAVLECTLLDCGDGYVNRAAGEECDLGRGTLAKGRKDWNRCNGPDAPEGIACRLKRCGDDYTHDEECDEADTQTCNGANAPDDVECDESRCGDGYVNVSAGEACEPDIDGKDTAACNGNLAAAGVACHAPSCGDGYVNAAAGEDCDPGDPSLSTPLTAEDESSATWSGCNGPSAGNQQCKFIDCGDGFTHPTEECDARENTFLCNGRKHDESQENDANIACTWSECGDGYVNAAAGEECDPGVATLDGQLDWLECNGPAAGPGFACRKTRCGDGYVNKSVLSGMAIPVEECEPAASTTHWFGFEAWILSGETAETFPRVCVIDSISGNDCRIARCGDGVVSRGEECDPVEEGADSPNEDSAGCNGSAAGLYACKVTSCGDGYKNPASEDCDPGSVRETEGCTKECTTSFCGDGEMNRAAGEECEVRADGTWKYCNEPILESDGVTISNPDFACTPVRCGDGYRNERVEVCSPTDLHEDWQIVCPADCSLPD